MTPGTGAYWYNGRRDASSADLPAQQLVIRDSDVDNVNAAWATRVFPRDHNVEYSAELVRGNRVMQQQSRAVDQ